MLLFFILCGMWMVYSISLSPNAILQSNHFSSDTQLTSTHSINNLSPSQPLILHLKPQTTFQNTLKFKLQSNQRQVECVFESDTGLCFMDNVSSSLNLTITCDHLPCQASWQTLQPPLNSLKNTEQVKQLYSMQESKMHMIVVLSCNNPQIKSVGEKVRAYSENAFIKLNAKNLVYFLFKNAKIGHLFLDIEDAVKPFMYMAIYRGTAELRDHTLVRDFVTKEEPVTYSLSRLQSSFKIEGSFHSIPESNSKLTIRLIGEKDAANSTIAQASVKSESASVAFAKSSQQYSSIYLQMISHQSTFMVTFEMNVSDKLTIEPSQHCYYSLKKDQALKYVVKSDPSAKDQKKQLITSDKVHISLSECSVREGCQVELTALEDVQGMISWNQNLSQKQIIAFTQQITHKIKEGDELYFKSELEAKKAIQVLLNSNNVMVYAASQTRCKRPSQQCYEKIGNIHNPFIYLPEKALTLVFMVVGLADCQFTLTLLPSGTDTIALTDGRPFSYLMDDQQSQLQFSFKVDEAKPVAFNLISSINDLMLVVGKGTSKPSETKDLISREGFISLTQTENRQFRILVKRVENDHKFIHFSLITTSHGTNMRLQPSTPHYETLKPKESRNYVFEFNQHQQYLMNFYIHNNPHQLNLSLAVLDKGNKLKQFHIQSSTDVLSLEEIASKLCKEEGELSCQVFLALTNAMNVEVDVTLTLLVKNSVIELKDGIWQSFLANTIAETSHFYFIPKAFDHSLSIMYRSKLVDLSLNYTLWESDQNSINPRQWPFPTCEEEKSPIPINQIVIDQAPLKECKPYCVVLLSVCQWHEEKLKNVPIGFKDTFSLMAAYNYLEIPEKTKLEVFVKKGQQKLLLVDLKYMMEKQVITFFTENMLGYVQLQGNVYSQANPRCPSQYEGDFEFGQLQTQITLKSIERQLEQMDMEKDHGLYLCILASSTTDSKFTIEYSSDDHIMKLITLNTFQHIQLSENEVKMYQMEADQQYELKFTREKGYYYYQCKQCNKNKDYEKCVEEFQEEEGGNKVLSKVVSFKDEPCLGCLLFVKVWADDAAQIILHAGSKYSVIELKENDPLTDVVGKDLLNYRITGVRNEEIIINVHVISGDPVVKVLEKDFNVTKEKDPKTNLIHIVVPAREITQSSYLSSLNQKTIDALKFSQTYRSLLVSIKSKEESTYTITYSSGEPQTFLKDGMVLGYQLQKEKKATFFCNSPGSKTYLSISSDNSSSLAKVNISFFYFEDEEKEQLQVKKPALKRKTQNASITYILPQKDKISLQLTAKQDIKITLILNDQELILLPLNQVFPLILEPSEETDIMVDANPGYMNVVVKKCDRSSPTLSYTLSQKGFIKSLFQSEIALDQGSTFQYSVKVSKPTKLLMNLKSGSQKSIMSVWVTQNKSKTQKMKPGNDGIIQYQLMTTKRVKIKFVGVECTKCSVEYHWVASTSLQQTYAQTVCPASLFQNFSSQQKTVQYGRLSENGQNQIEFDYQMKNQIEYIGVKAVIGEKQVFYEPIQIRTMWAAISSPSTNHFSWVYVGALSVCVLLIGIRRRMKRSSYEAIRSQVDI